MNRAGGVLRREGRGGKGGCCAAWAAVTRGVRMTGTAASPITLGTGDAIAVSNQPENAARCGHNHRMPRPCNATKSDAWKREQLRFGKPLSAGLTFIVDKPNGECRMRNFSSILYTAQPDCAIICALPTRYRTVLRMANSMRIQSLLQATLVVAFTSLFCLSPTHIAIAQELQPSNDFSEPFNLSAEDRAEFDAITDQAGQVLGENSYPQQNIWSDSTIYKQVTTPTGDQLFKQKYQFYYKAMSGAEVPENLKQSILHLNTLGARFC